MIEGSDGYVRRGLNRPPVSYRISVSPLIRIVSYPYRISVSARIIGSARSRENSVPSQTFFSRLSARVVTPHALKINLSHSPTSADTSRQLISNQPCPALEIQ